MTISILCLLFVTISFAQSENIPDSKYFPPTGEPKNIALLLLGGSEGGLPDYYDTDGLTALGYPCLIVGYFKTQNTPDHLEMIPLEYFEQVIASFKAKPQVQNKKIIVWGGSKGGELALLLASRYKEIQGVIAAVPGCVVFQGIGGPSSSWSFKGNPLPFVPYAPYDYSKIVNSEYVELYQLSLNQTEAVKKAAIQVENINGPVLILTGKKDSMWPSSRMGNMIIQRLKEHNFPFWYKHIAYENAGHTLNDSYMMGGTKEGNKKASIDSKQQILDFLDRLNNE